MTGKIDLADHPPGTRFLAYAPAQMQALIDGMAQQVMPLLVGQEKIAIIGVLRRGAPLADMLAAALCRQFQVSQPLRLDLKVKRYADDLKLLHPETQLTESAGQADLNLSGYTLIVVDDVLYTGSSLLRVIEWLNAKSPRAIHTAVLADRHVAQLPIKADVVGVHLQVAPGDVVECHVPPYEPLFQIELLRLDNAV
jgi:pyrimidine operon attenuation protein/uracil phosphoribosyltransferase